MASKGFHMHCFKSAYRVRAKATSPVAGEWRKDGIDIHYESWTEARTVCTSLRPTLWQAALECGPLGAGESNLLQFVGVGFGVGVAPSMRLDPDLVGLQDAVVVFENTPVASIVVPVLGARGEVIIPTGR